MPPEILPALPVYKLLYPLLHPENAVLFFAFFLLLLPGKSLKFFLRKSKLRASDNYSHGKCARIFPSFISETVSPTFITFLTSIIPSFSIFLYIIYG